MRKKLLTAALMVLATTCHAERARDLGIPFDGTPGPLKAITDVAGVTVGHTTLVADTEEGHAVRTGVTAILPRGRCSNVLSAPRTTVPHPPRRVVPG